MEVARVERNMEHANAIYYFLYCTVHTRVTRKRRETREARNFFFFFNLGNFKQHINWYRIRCFHVFSWLICVPGSLLHSHHVPSAVTYLNGPLTKGSGPKIGRTCQRCLTCLIDLCQILPHGVCLSNSVSCSPGRARVGHNFFFFFVKHKYPSS